MPASEAHEQEMLLRWLRLNKLDAFSIPSEGARSPRFAARLKRSGWVAGLPDLILFDLAPDRAPVAVEMKSPKGRVSPKQKAMHERLRASGWHVVVGFGWRDAVHKLGEIWDA